MHSLHSFLDGGAYAYLGGRIFIEYNLICHQIANFLLEIVISLKRVKSAHFLSPKLLKLYSSYNKKGISTIFFSKKIYSNAKVK